MRSAYFDADRDSVSITANGTPNLSAIPFAILRAVIDFPLPLGPNKAHLKYNWVRSAFENDIILAPFRIYTDLFYSASSLPVLRRCLFLFRFICCWNRQFLKEIAELAAQAVRPAFNGFAMPELNIVIFAFYTGKLIRIFLPVKEADCSF
jgi:hypothetical protein